MPSLPPIKLGPQPQLLVASEAERRRAEVVSATERFLMRAALAPMREDPAQYAEVLRVCRMPLTHGLTQDEFEAYCRANILGSAFDRGWRLFPVQAYAVLSYELYGGLFAPIGVGWGKTLISLMIAEKAFRAGHKKTLMLMPSSVYSQLVNSNIPWARTKIPLSVPFHGLGGRSMSERRMITRSGRVGCYLMPYSQLSTKDTRTVNGEIGTIESIDPTVIIGDEIHYLANRGAARTQRLVNWMKEARPQLACMSGTITNKSVRDYHHLASLSLGERSPLPLSPQLAGEWGQVLDADSYFCDSQTGPIKPLVDWARTHFPGIDFSFDRSGFRRAFKMRLTTAPGVVSTGDTEIQTSLTLTNKPVKSPEKSAGWDRLEELTKGVEELFVTPNGDEIEHRIHAHKWLRELTAGFYNELVWPTAESLVLKLNVTADEAESLLERALAHHEKRQAYAKALRRWIKDHERPGLDTPMAIGSDMAHHGPANVGAELYSLWKTAKDAEFDGMPERIGRAVRVCDYKVAAAVSWCKSLPMGEGALLWYQHQEVGKWFMEQAKAEGLDVLHCPAGASSNKALDLDQNPQNKKKILVCSISAHKEGKNLQPMGHTYFLEWQQTAKVCEQVLGRNHRMGQERDELAPVTCHTTGFDRLSFAASLNDALYIHQTTGNRQKLVYCGYDPMPPVFPPEVLRERGFQPKQLSEEQRSLLEERFGGYKESS